MIETLIIDNKKYIKAIHNKSYILADIDNKIRKGDGWILLEPEYFNINYTSDLFDKQEYYTDHVMFRMYNNKMVPELYNTSFETGVVFAENRYPILNEDIIPEVSAFVKKEIVRLYPELFIQDKK